MDKDDKRKELKELLTNLLSIPSPTGREKKIGNWIEEYLTEIGFNIRRESIEEGRDNIIATRGETDYMIATHIDTVPEWGFKDAYKPRWTNNKAYGRGAVDTKGQIASLLLAAKYTENNCTLVFFVDEEKDGRGSELFKPDKRYRGAIVLEPTNLTLAVSQSGSIELSLKVKGEKSHGAVPGRGRNAIETFYTIYRELEDLPHLRNRQPDFKYAGINIGRIQGGIDCQVVADECFVDLDIPVFPGNNLEDVWRKVEEILGRYNIDWEIKVFDSPYELSKKEEIVRILSKSLELEGLKVEYTPMLAWTDAANLIDKGIPSVVFGAGELSIAHTEREQITMEDLLTL
ncbi:MAG TPA: M20/M25/M40 family metallo-hydrolase, partial [Thermoplasmatales archaeon]|nr:M20/M25/M40 family metallo-hydrolase [Thermoplasmatales archaeon]